MQAFLTESGLELFWNPEKNSELVYDDTRLLRSHTGAGGRVGYEWPSDSA